MKKTVVLLSALMFSFALALSNLTWADDAKHIEEGSGMKTTKSSPEEGNASKEYKDKKLSKEYQSGKEGHIKEVSGEKQSHDQSADHQKMEDGSGVEKRMKTAAPKREGS